MQRESLLIALVSAQAQVLGIQQAEIELLRQGAEIPLTLLEAKQKYMEDMRLICETIELDMMDCGATRQ